jgi:hypothetical protein
MIQLVLKLFLDHVPSFLCVGDDAPGTVFEASGQDTEVTRAWEKEERAVAEEAWLPVIKLMARQKFAFGINKMFIIHIL